MDRPPWTLAAVARLTIGMMAIVLLLPLLLAGMQLQRAVKERIDE